MMKGRLKERKLHSKLIEIQLIECGLLILLFVLSYDIAWGIIYNNFFPFFILNYHLRHLMLSVLIIIILSFYRYFNFLDQSYAEAIKKIVAAGFLLNVIFIALLYFSNYADLSVYYFIAAYLLQIILLIIFKVFTNMCRRIFIHSNFNVLVVKDFAVNELLKALQKERNGMLAVVTYENENLQYYVEKADNIYLTGAVTAEVRNKVLSYCTLKDKRVYIIPEIFEIAVRNSTVTYIGDIPLFALENFHLTEAQKFVKRTVDIALSALGIVITLPIFLFVIIAIKQDDNGPVFYRQERIGLNGKPFKVIKFRSMVEDAEKDTGAVLATENDHRITKTGCYMRSTRIDEIPQFFNVLTGSMSLVGPRPERPSFIKEYDEKYPEYHHRLAVKPGITGLAQVKGNYTTTAENKIKFDLMYIINYSLFLDIKILFQTVKVMLNKKQAKGFAETRTIKYVNTTDLRLKWGDEFWKMKKRKF